MPGSQPILPVLKPHNWGSSDYLLSRPLVMGVGVLYIPWVGFGYHHPETFELVSRDSFPESDQTETIRLIEQAALRNLRMRPIDWRTEKISVGWLLIGKLRPMRLLIGSGDYLAAERILDPQTMIKAAQLLKAHRIVVGVPCRGVLVATNARQSRDRLIRFSAMVSTHYHKNTHAAISPSVFILEEGKIVGVVTGQERAGLALVQPREETREKVFFRAVITADRKTGHETLHLLAGCPDFERLEIALTPAFAKSVEEMIQRPEFSGQVRIILVPELVPRTADLPNRIAHLQRHFSGIIDEINQVHPVEHAYQVTVLYGLENLPPEAGEPGANQLFGIEDSHGTSQSPTDS